MKLRGLLRPRAPLPPLRGYAASPDVHHHLVERVWAQRPALVAECGSLVDPVSYAVRANGGGREVALEHDPAWAEVSCAYVTMHGLDDVAEVPGGAPHPVRVGRLVMALIRPCCRRGPDGHRPALHRRAPGDTSAMARYQAGPVRSPRCSPGVSIFLDDTHRRDERPISARWREEFPKLRVENVRAGKGLHVLRYDGA